MYGFNRDAGNKSTDSDDILAGEVKYVEVVLDYQTLTEDAINTSLAIALPSSLLKPPASITSTTVTLIKCRLSVCILVLYRCSFQLNQPLPNCKAESSSNYTCELERKFADFDEVRIIFHLPPSPSPPSLPPFLPLDFKLQLTGYTHSPRFSLV